MRYPRNEPVSPTNDETGSEDEGPVLERRERVGDCAFVPARVLLRERHDGEHGEDADEDEVHSTMRAVTYPNERMWFCRFTMG